LLQFWVGINQFIPPLVYAFSCIVTVQVTVVRRKQSHLTADCWRNKHVR